MKIRSLKPELVDDEDLGAVPIAARFLFVGLITRADDDGRLRAHPALLRSTIYPYDEEVTVGQVRGWLGALAARGLVVLYTVAGQAYAALPGWTKHQRIKRDHYVPSQLPPPPDTLGHQPATVRPPDGHPPATEGAPTGTPDRSGLDRSGLDRSGDVCTETRETRSVPATDTHPAPVPQDEPEEVAEGDDATHDPPTHPAGSQGPPSTPEPLTLALPSAPSEPEPGGEVVLTYPCDGRPPRWDLTRRQVDEWARLYPRLDVEDECRRALAWVSASPSRRKTARGMPRMLVSWLSRATDRPASARAGPGGQGGLPPPQVMSDRGRQQMANGLEWIRRAEEEDRRRAAEEVST